MMKAVCRRPPCHSFVMLKSFSTASNTPAKKNIQCPIYFKRTGPKGWCPCSVHKTFSRIGFRNKKIVHENSKSWISRETFVTTVKPLNSEYPLFIDNLGLTALTALPLNPGFKIRHFEKNSRGKKLKTQGKNLITQGKNSSFWQFHHRSFPFLAN